MCCLAQHVRTNLAWLFKMFWQRSVPVKDGDFALQFFGNNLPFFFLRVNVTS